MDIEEFYEADERRRRSEEIVRLRLDDLPYREISDRAGDFRSATGSLRTCVLSMLLDRQWEAEPMAVGQGRRAGCDAWTISALPEL